MGLHTGSVVVSGGGEVAVGEPIELARRLKDLAEAGAVVISDGLRELLGPQLELEAIPDQAEEAAPSAWRVSAMATDLAVGASWSSVSLSPLIGRVRELATLEELREEAEAGKGQVVGITGEAGAGKSRFLYEFSRTLRGRRLSYLRGECVSYGSGVPYLPWVQMIRHASRISESDSPADIAVKLRSSLEAVGSDPEPCLPYLLRLLEVREGTETLDTLEPLALQAQTFAAIRRMVLDASQQSLVVMVIEDLHWIDQTSEDLLASLVEEMPAASILLLLTYRSGYQPRFMDKSYSTQINMKRLSANESQALAEALLKRADLDEELLEEVVQKAEGSPFFLEELARSLAKLGEGERDSIPTTIQGVLMARIDRLPAVQKRLLQTASVLSRVFPVDLLEAMWDRPEALERQIEELRKSEFLHKIPTTGREQYSFQHALTQEVTYQSLLTSRRQALHAQAAAALEELYADRLEDVYDRLIYHYPRADQSEKTVHYLTLFASRAAGSYAHAEAAKALSEALVQAEKLPETRSGPSPDRDTLATRQLALAARTFPRDTRAFRALRKHMPSASMMPRSRLGITSGLPTRIPISAINRRPVTTRSGPLLSRRPPATASRRARRTTYSVAIDSGLASSKKG